MSEMVVKAPPTSFLVFADDWGRHPSSCQHLFRHLVDRYPVDWINTIGTRRPSFNLATLTRGFEKIGHWLFHRGSGASRPANLHVRSPWMWPWFSTPFDRGINRKLLLRQLTRHLNSLAAPPVAVTTLPIVADLVGTLPVRRWVYYCVDDFSVWPGLDSEPLRRMEQELVRKADVLVAVSETLQMRLAQMGRESHLLTHGVDLGHWKKASNEPLPQLNGLLRPLVVFWGVIDRRMDVDWVRWLVQALPGGTVVLVGPKDNPDPALFQLPRVSWVPPMAYEQLPAVAHEAAVLIMPYADLPVTQAMQPLKLKEYLATGKPTVVRDLPANREWADCMDMAATPDAFAQTVVHRLQTGLSGEQHRARARLTGEGWDAKARMLEQWMLGDLV